MPTKNVKNREKKHEGLPRVKSLVAASIRTDVDEMVVTPNGHDIVLVRRPNPDADHSRGLLMEFTDKVPEISHEVISHQNVVVCGNAKILGRVTFEGPGSIIIEDGAVIEAKGGRKLTIICDAGVVHFNEHMSWMTGGTIRIRGSDAELNKLRGPSHYLASAKPNPLAIRRD